MGLLRANGLGAQGVFTPNPRKPAQPCCASQHGDVALLATLAHSTLIHQGAVAHIEAR